MNRALVIENPAAGGAKRSGTLRAVVRVLQERGCGFEMCVTNKFGDATEYVRRYAGDADVIVCSGGDGTLGEVVEGVMRGGLNTPICYLPSGTTNDMARALSLPLGRNASACEKAAEMFSGGQVRCHDAGLFNGGRCITYTAAFGAFADTSYKTPRVLKSLLGHNAYRVYGAACLRSVRPYRAVFDTDAGTYEGRFVFGCISNSTSVGGVIRLSGYDVRYDDGLMELLLVRWPENPAQLARTLSAMIRGDYNREYFIFAHVTRVQASFEKPAEWTVDGEFAGTHQQVDVKVRPNAYRILVS